MTTTRRTPSALLSGLSLATLLTAALAGCSSDTSAEAAAPRDGAASSGYADGSYDATGSYASPAGEEKIDVSVTLADGVVTAVEVEPQATNPTSRSFQTDFASAVAGEVVGKSIDGLSLDAVSGASLTTEGFTDALEQIAADARR